MRQKQQNAQGETAAGSTGKHFPSAAVYLLEPLHWETEKSPTIRNFWNPTGKGAHQPHSVLSGTCSEQKAGLNDLQNYCII